MHGCRDAKIVQEMQIITSSNDYETTAKTHMENDDDDSIEYDNSV